jgi:hypothetical protein
MGRGAHGRDQSAHPAHVGCGLGAPFENGVVEPRGPFSEGGCLNNLFEGSLPPRHGFRGTPHFLARERGIEERL